jgi:hypothetical protein
MLSSVFRFVRLPFLLVLIWTVARFSLGLAGVPYAPRGNAMFSVYSVMLLSSIYFGALSSRIGGFDWKGTALVGASIGVWAQLLILVATLISYAAGLNTYFIHWDALNVDPAKFSISMGEALTNPPEQLTLPMSQAMIGRAAGIVINGIMMALVALIGRLLSGLAPERNA